MAPGKPAQKAATAEVPAVVIGPAESGQASSAAAKANGPETATSRRPRVATAARHLMSELVCLRALDGRPCAAADAARQHRRGAEVVVLEIPPRRNGGRSSGGSSSTNTAPTAAPRVPPAVSEIAVEVVEALTAASVTAIHDVCARGETPGARFFAWEAAGVPLRIEVGEREAAGRAVTLAVHPALVNAELLAGLAARPELSDMVPEAAAAETAAAAAAACGQALRLGPVAVVQVAEVCRVILEVAAGKVAAAVEAAQRSPRPVLLPHGHCPKLHLWPEASPPPCAVHIRHLLHVGLPCHCRVAPHPTMEALRDEVAAALARRGRCVARWEHADSPPPPPPITTVFVSGLPPEAGVGALQRALAAALEPYGLVRVQVAVGARGRPRGWARAVVQTPKAEAAIADLDGKLEVKGRTGVSVSHATGRADALFSRLPFDTRCRLRIDDVAAFSVMDDTSGDSMAALAAAVTAAAAGLPLPAPTLAAAAETASADGVAAEGRAPLVLSCADITACCGGTTMALARAFDRVTAVEIDPGRCDDLAHNLSVAGLSVRRVAQAELPAWSSDADGGKQQSAGGVAVLCGDAVALLDRLGPHDCFVVDPPWGGPSYLQQGGATQEAEQDDDGSSGDGEPEVSHPESDSTADPAAGEAQQQTRQQPGDAGRRPSRAAAVCAKMADMPLGGESLVRLCVRLAALARVALLRLPSRGFDFEAFAEAVAAGCEATALQQAIEAAGVDKGGSSRISSSSNPGGAMAPLILSSELGRSQLLVVVYGGSISAIEPPSVCRPESRPSRVQWQLHASSKQQQQEQQRQQAQPRPLPEPVRVFDRRTRCFVRCEKSVRS